MGRLFDVPNGKNFVYIFIYTYIFLQVEYESEGVKFLFIWIIIRLRQGKHFCKTFQNQMWMECECYNEYVKKGITCYTDGSRTPERVGAGICSERPKKDLRSLWWTVPQSSRLKFYAIITCIQENVKRGYKRQQIDILADSKADLKALKHLLSILSGRENVVKPSRTYLSTIELNLGGAWSVGFWR